MGKLSLIVGLFGSYGELLNDFSELTEELYELSKDIEVIIVADGEKWTFSPLFSMLKYKIENCKTIIMEKTTDLPAMVFYEGLKHSKSEYVNFVYPKAKNIKIKSDIFINKSDQITDEVCYFRNLNIHAPLAFPNNQNRFGLLLYKPYYAIEDLFIKRESLPTEKLFFNNEMLKTKFDWLLTLDLAKNFNFKEIGTLDELPNEWINYPFTTKKIYHDNIVSRYISRMALRETDEISLIVFDESFFYDLDSIDQEYFSRISKNKFVKTTKSKPIFITVVGGFWEYHHNQICFFNYFQKSCGEGLFTFNTKFDLITTNKDIENSDLVIFSRCRSDESIKLIEFCNENNIPTIYMIDDNWISIGKDHPEYGAIFSKGNPNYDNFIRAIGLVDTTWLFNDILAEDIGPFAKHITKFKISLDANDFIVDNKRLKSDSEIYIGFSGSLRFDNIAFKALARAAKKYKNVKVILFGILSKEQLELFEGIDIINIGFSSYPIYARSISTLSPDLLIAPLQDTRTAKSKCYNKYIENSIIGAATLFSKLPPYEFVVNDNVNGFFVEDDSETGWYNKLCEILDNPNMLRTVQENAYKDVTKNHVVEALLDEFIDNIQNVYDRRISTCTI